MYKKKTLTVDEVKAWLDTLPRANLGKTAEMLHDYVRQIPHDSLTPKQSFDILEVIQETMDFLWEVLRKHFLGLTTISHQQRPQIVTLAQAIENSYATAYASLAHKVAENDPSNQERLHLLCLYRAITHLRKMLLASYLLHANPPKNLWLKIHKLYIHSKKYKLNNQGFVLAKEKIPHTIDSAYKHCLLLSTSNPFHLDEHDIDKVDQALVRWAEYAKLTTTDDEDAFFNVHTNLDCQPQYKKFDSFPQDKLHTLSLSTFSLVEHIEQMTKQRETTEIAHHTMTPMPKSLMHYLCNIWSHLHIRHHVRAETNIKANVCVGLGSIFHHLEPQQISSSRGKVLHPTTSNRDLQLVKPDDEHKPIIENLPTASGQNTQKQAYYDPWDSLEADHEKTSEKIAQYHQEAERYKAHEWQIIDKSKGGYRLLSPKEFIPEIQPGELVGIQKLSEDLSNAWSIAHICWVKLEKNEGTHIGCQVFSHSATAASLELKDDSYATPFKAILLGRGEQEETLLIQGISVHPEQQALLRHSCLEAVIKFKSILASNKYFIHISYETLDTLKEKVDFSEEKINDDDGDIWEKF